MKPGFNIYTFTQNEPVHVSFLRLKKNKIAFTLFSKRFRLINENDFSTSYILQLMSVIIIQ